MKGLMQMKKSLCALMCAIVGFAGAEPLTLTWNGGSTGNLSSGPWSGGAGDHQTPQNGDTLVFTTGGTIASDIAGLKVAALQFASASAVTLSGSEAIVIQAGGSVTSTAAGKATVSAPLVSGETATDAGITIAASSGFTLEITGALSGTAPITVGASNGTVAFKGANTFTGVLTVNNGLFTAEGANALGAVGTEPHQFVTGNGKGKAKVTLNGVTLDRPLAITAGNSSQETTWSGTCTFKKSVTVTGSPAWIVSNWATITFSDTLSISGTAQVQVYTGARVVVNGTGNYFGYNNFAVTGTFEINNPIEVNGWNGKSIRYSASKGTYKFGCDNALFCQDEGNPSGALIINLESGVNSCVFDLNGHDQRVLCIRDTPQLASNVIKSDSTSCTFHLMQQTSKTTHPELAMSDVAATFTGKVNLSVEGSDPLVLKSANTSTGALVLTNQADVSFGESGSWAGGKVVIAGGSALKLDKVGNLTAAKLDIELIDEVTQEGTTLCSKLTIPPEGLTVPIKINGEPVAAGTWGATGSGAEHVDDDHFAGTGTAFVWPDGRTAATWNAGAGANESLAADANWVGGKAPNLTSGETVASFATDGANAVVGSDVSLGEIKFEGAAATFALTQSGDGRISVRDGITVADSHAATLDVPVRFVGEQTVAVGASGSLTVEKPLSSFGDGTIVKEGSGSLVLAAANEFGGDFEARDGVIQITAASNAFGCASDTAKAVFWERYGRGTPYCSVVFADDTTVDRPVEFHSDTGYNNFITVNSGVEVVFRKPVVFGLRWNKGWTDGRITFGNTTSRMVFEGGLVLCYLTAYNSGRLVVRNQPVSGVMQGANDALFLTGATLELDVSGNVLPNLIQLMWNAGLEFGADYAISNSLQAVRFKVASANWNGSVKLNGHSQRIGALYADGGYACNGSVTSTDPAQLIVSSLGSPSLASGTNSVIYFTGAAGLALAATNDNIVAGIGRDMGSSGPVGVSRGTLDFTPQGTWLNSTNVTVGGTGVLRLAAERTFSKKADWTITTTEGAKLVLGDGVSEVAHQVTVNGETLAPGVYGSLASDAPHKVAWIEGNGTLRARAGGIVLIVR